MKFYFTYTFFNSTAPKMMKSLMETSTKFSLQEKSNFQLVRVPIEKLEKILLPLLKLSKDFK